MSVVQAAAATGDPSPKPRNVTLLELVQSVCEVTTDDCEVVATVRHMLGTGRVRLSGNFRGLELQLL